MYGGIGILLVLGSLLVGLAVAGLFILALSAVLGYVLTRRHFQIKFANQDLKQYQPPPPPESPTPPSPQ